jgi:exodeoxyribonuclease V alpha subunit
MSDSTQIDAFAHLLLGQPTVPETLAQLQAWVSAACLRPLDYALAHFLCQCAPDTATPELLLATALCAHLEGRGHTCLSLHLLSTSDQQPLQHWNPLATAELRLLLERMPRSLNDWHHILHCSPTVHDTARPELKGNAPLVLTRDRLYLRRYWHMERTSVDQIRQRLCRHIPVDACTVQTELNRLFLGPVCSEFDWQRFACANALRHHLSIITGGPGTGKTYAAARLLSLLHATHTGANPLRVGLGAPTGKAAARLKQSIDAAFTAFPAPYPPTPPARTLHAWLGARPHTRQMAHHRSHPLPLDVLIIDEVSMLHLEMLHHVLEALAPHTRLILMGDPDQLASVEAGAVLGDLALTARQHRYSITTAAYALAATGQSLPDENICPDAPEHSLAQNAVQLQRSHRFSGPIALLALAVNQGDAARAQTLLQAPGKNPLQWIKGPSTGLQDLANLAVQGYRAYTTAIAQGPVSLANHTAWVHHVLSAFDQFRILCALREGPWGVAGLNTLVENALLAQGLLGRSASSSPWMEGRPILVTRNDHALGVFNGDIGITLRSSTDQNAPLRIYFSCTKESDLTHSVSPHRLADVQAAYAMTVHKSQGSEFHHTLLVLPPTTTSPEPLSRELLYTAITRAKEAFTLVTPEPRTWTAALGRPTQRYSGLFDLISQN